MRFRGDVYRSGQLVAPGVTGEMQQGQTPSGFISWTGWFIVPPGCGVGPGDDYELRTQGGPQGGIRILGLSAGSNQQTIARFKSNGPFQ